MIDKLVINGENELSGILKVSGAKNAALPLLAGGLLSSEEITLTNLPKLRDVKTMLSLLESFGVKVNRGDDFATMDFGKVTNTKADYHLVKTMRASVQVLGPLLARFGKCEVSLPGGCAIGARPVDIHLKGLERMGAKINIENGYILAEAKKLKGAEIDLSFPSVGATENLMSAATLATGETIIRNAAKEPEIVDLANFLRGIGASISGDGTEEIKIEGKESLCGGTYKVMDDRIESGTFAILAVIANANITVDGFRESDHKALLNVFEEMGVSYLISDGNKFIHKKNDQSLRPVSIETGPFPEYATDLQAQIMALMTIIPGRSSITENIFEKRFMHVPEMIRMGAKISLDGKKASIEGVEKDSLSGAPVMCTDLRASAALALMSMIAKGESIVQRVYHLDRGYEKIEEKLSFIGADIKRVKTDLKELT